MASTARQSKGLDIAQRRLEDLLKDYPRLTGLKVDSIDGVRDLTTAEQEIVNLYKSLNELELETTLVEITKAEEENLPDATAEEITEASISELEQELLEAKALYTLKTGVADGIGSIDPILSAVHGDARDKRAELSFLPLLLRRDALAMGEAELAREHAESTLKIASLRSARLGLAAKNRDLATQVLALAADVKKKDSRDIEDDELMAQASDLEKQLAIGAGRRQILKNVVSAIIAGSGLDWVGNEQWRSLVLDDPD